MRKLRSTLAAIALAAPLPACFDSGSNCPDPAPRYTSELGLGADPSADPELAPLVAACKQQMDCEPLCDKAWERMYSYVPTPDQLQDCALRVDAPSNQHFVSFSEAYPCLGGRRPAGYHRSRACDRTSPLAVHFGHQADLEAASVRAFADLLDDVIALNGPVGLRRAIVAAAGDEVRHARICRGLARRFGGRPQARTIPKAPRRSRYELAADNLIEGCVRETYGAVLAGYQARAAGDAQVRRAMRAIARDEARHAALSWRLHAWLWPQLSADERAELRARSRAARAELRPDTERADAEISRVAGLPDAIAAQHMLAELERTVWAAI